MSGLLPQSDSPIASKDDLVAYIASGSKPPLEWRIGTEHEKFAYDLTNFRPLPYDGRPGIRAFLEGMTRFGWKPVVENGNPIALSRADGAAVTLEPAGQVELSGAPLDTIHETCREVTEHLNQVKEVGAEMNIGFLGLGYHPTMRVEDMPWMPKWRYAIMRRYMPTKGTLGLDMMTTTCTVQVNLDFDSEATMIKMFRVSLALQPVAVALFANSPFRHGGLNGFQSFRSHVWTDTDPDRSGTLPFVFESGFGFERYVDYMLDVPMYFVYRKGVYIDAAGQSFRDFVAGKLPALPGQQPVISDWVDHLTTAFPEVRLKRYLEMRGADGGPWKRLCALPALWTGLLYDRSTLDAAWDLVKDWTPEEHEQLRDDVPRHGLATPFRKGTLGDVAVRVVALARDGLRRRARLDSTGQDESHFINTLADIADRRKTPADDLIDLYKGRWQGRVEPVFTEFAY
ncbi:MAG: glutamate--cysteine ligase [Alphaproteobacteria bacterium]|nr:glutamate--cysteine ligase [Alphaproteobacteria bacterium]